VTDRFAELRERHRIMERQMREEAGKVHTGPLSDHPLDCDLLSPDEERRIVAARRLIFGAPINPPQPRKHG